MRSEQQQKGVSAQHILLLLPAEAQMSPHSQRPRFRPWMDDEMQIQIARSGALHLQPAHDNGPVGGGGCGGWVVLRAVIWSVLVHSIMARWV